MLFKRRVDDERVAAEQRDSKCSVDAESLKVRSCQLCVCVTVFVYICSSQLQWSLLKWAWV